MNTFFCRCSPNQPGNPPTSLPPIHPTPKFRNKHTHWIFCQIPLSYSEKVTLTTHVYVVQTDRSLKFLFITSLKTIYFLIRFPSLRILFMPSVTQQSITKKKILARLSQFCLRALKVISFGEKKKNIYIYIFSILTATQPISNLYSTIQAYQQ